MSSHEDSLTPDESPHPGGLPRHQEPGVSASSSKDKNNQKRLSQVVPKRPKSKELVNEEEPWDAKNILSFDGGGIRGLYSLLILQHLMNNIKLIEESFSDGEGKVSHALSSFSPLDEPLNVSHKPRTPRNEEQAGENGKIASGHFLPCHYFDYICGTSTGGLIAIMLSRLRMPIEDCILEYENLAGRVFGNARVFHQTFLPTMWLKRPKYDAATLEGVIGRVVRRRGEISSDSDRIPFKTGRGTCRVFVFAYKKEGHDDQNAGLSFEVPYIFRSYDHYRRGANGSPFLLYPRNPGEASSFPIWKVARATTAAPLYFAPMQVIVDGDTPQPREGIINRMSSRVKTFGRGDTSIVSEPSRPVTFIDGGFGEANNPSKEAFHEVKTSNEKIGTFVSIGTGRGRVDKFHTGLARFVKAGLASIGDPEPAHILMQAESNHPENGFGYFRLNQPNGLPDLDFDEWRPRRNGKRTRKKIEDAFRRWAIDPKVAADLQRCALEPVRRRRLRTTDESQWERYALEAFFDCQEDRCPQPTAKRWYNRNDFQNHLMVDHGIEEGPELLQKLASHRRAWRYKPPTGEVT